MMCCLISVRTVVKGRLLCYMMTAECIFLHVIFLHQMRYVIHPTHEMISTECDLECFPYLGLLLSMGCDGHASHQSY